MLPGGLAKPCCNAPPDFGKMELTCLTQRAAGEMQSAERRSPRGTSYEAPHGREVVLVADISR